MVRKDPVHNVNEAYVRQLMVSEDVTEEKIQEALTRILTQHTLDLENSTDVYDEWNSDFRSVLSPILVQK